MSGGCGKAVRRREIGGEEKNQNERNDKGADGALAMEQFEREISQSEKPAEKRKRTVEVVVRNGVKAAGALQKRKIVCGEAEGEKKSGAAASALESGVEKTDIQAKTGEVGDHGEDDERMIH